MPNVTDSAVQTVIQTSPDHPNYLIYLAQNPMTNTVTDIVANNSLLEINRTFN
jgi:hypothetical protein